jgi:hypothetical protein
MVANRENCKEKAGIREPAPIFLTSPQFERSTSWLEAERVRRLLRFSLADSERRKSRKPAPLPVQCWYKPANAPRGYCIERCGRMGWGGLWCRGASAP